jgi:hypothetical protein
MNKTKLKVLIPEDASDSVRLADEYTPFVFSHPESFEAGGIYLFAAPNTPDLERHSTELAVKLSRDAPVLVINTCIEEHSMRMHLKTAGAGLLPIKTIPLDDGLLALRFDELCGWIEQSSAKAVIINCFERAAVTARHQMQLTQLFHELRNKHKVAILVYSSLPIGRLKLANNTRRGAHGQLTFLAKKMLEAGSQLTIDEQLALPKYIGLMGEHQQAKDDSPPPPQAVDVQTLEEFNRDNAEMYLVKEDELEEWMNGGKG